MLCLYISLSSVSRKDMSIASLNLGRRFWYFATMFSNTLGAMPEVSIAFRKLAFWMRFFEVGICHGLLIFSCLMFSDGLFADALSCKVQIANKIGLEFQQNLLKVYTNIVLYQNLVDDTIIQI